MTNETELRAKLIQQLSSHDPKVVMSGVSDLEKNGWLYDGSLKGTSFAGGNFYELILSECNLPDVDFSRGCLHGVDFTKANLQGAKFLSADLTRVMMDESNLQSAIFDDADLSGGLITNNLEGASFERANLRYAGIGSKLRNASFRYANLQDAHLTSDDARGCNFSEANLQNTKLRDVIFDANTILPNGIPWTPEIDLMIFTDSSHPNFWRSQDTASPAHPNAKEKE
ncbi:MAG: pentapeptide repeat-containing protein [Chloroflexota bacterium]